MSSMEEIIKTRLTKLITRIKEENNPAFLVFSDTSIRYLTGFTGEEAQLLVEADGSVTLLSDSRFASQIEANLPKFIKIVMKTKSVPAELNDLFVAKNLQKTLIEGDFVSATFLESLKAAMPNVTFTLVTEIVEQLRMVKDDSEIALIEKAIAISKESFEAILPKIVAGKTELQLAAELEFEMKSRGATGPSFETIIASGVRSAWPHGSASPKKLANHELITIDYGCFYGGYVSDITRTVALGTVDAKLEEIYNVVLAANKAGIKAAQVGNTGADVDCVARSIINDAGYGQYFGHGIGHGIGLDIHEINSPTMRFKETKLVDNLVITVEPGIYLPDFGGVRIEDDVLTGASPKVLTDISKDELLIL